MKLRFADCVLDCDQHDLRRAGERVDVQPKVWSFLKLLAENGHRVVPKDEILDRLWPDAVVAEGSLQRLARLARVAVGSDRVLRTVRGVGYQLDARVEAVGCAEGDASTASGLASPPGSESEAGGGSQEIRFCTSADGVNLAWTATGEGPSLVRALGWFTNLEYEWAWTRARRFWEAFGAGRRLVRYDGRGMGLSDPSSEFSAKTRLLDLEAVVEAAGVGRFDLVGLSEGCGTAVAYAVRHPHRVRRLVLYGPPAFLFVDWNPELTHLGRVIQTLIDAAWGGRSERFGRMLAELFVGHGADEEIRALFDRMQRASTDRDTAARYVGSLPADVRAEARRIAVPTLVVHRRDDAIATFESAKAAAALIPGARFVPIAGDNHWPMADDLSAPTLVRAMRDFLDEAPDPEHSAARGAPGRP